MSSEVLNELMRRSESLSLTDEEKMRLANHLASVGNIQAGRPAETEDNGDTSKPDPERRRERQWLLQHGKEYEGQWVALDGDCLLSHGTDGRLVLAEARRIGVSVPFVVRVEKPDELPFGGW
jgi:hypothetical protein